MKPLFVRKLRANERRTLQDARRSRDAFTLRRAQILLASADRQPPAQIAKLFGCATGTVRNTLRAFDTEGTDCLLEKKRGSKDVQPVLDDTKQDAFKAILHHSPRHFGKNLTLWTLELLAEVTFEQKLTPHCLSHEAIRQAVKRLGCGWKRAKQWISSPDPAYARKKKTRPTDPLGSDALGLGVGLSR